MSSIKPSIIPLEPEKENLEGAQKDYESARDSASDSPLNQDVRSAKDRIDHILSKNLPVGPRDGKRDILMRASGHGYQDHNNATGENWMNVITCKTRPSNGSGWDEAVHMSDVTGDALMGASVFGGSGYQMMHLYYTWSVWVQLGIQGGAMMRTIRVDFASGHQEDFQVLMPLTHIRHHHNITGIHTGGSLFMEIRDCIAFGGYWGPAGMYDSYYQDENYAHGLTPGSNELHYLTKWNPVDDPLNLLKSYEYLASGYSTSPLHGSQYHNNLATVGHGPGAAYGVTGMTVRGTTTDRQEFHSVDIIAQDNSPLGIDTTNINGLSIGTIQSNMTFSGSGGGITYSTFNGDSSPETNFSSLISWLLTHPGPTFAYRVYYAENLTDCTQPPSTTYYVCDTPLNPQYWQTTWLGSLTQGNCNDITIPVADRPGGSNFSNCTFVHDDACCFICTIITQASTSISAYATNTGTIQWDVADPAGSFTASGAPFSTQVYTGTASSMYTVSVTASTGAVLAQNSNTAYTGGATVTVGTGVTNGTNTVTCASNDIVYPGMKVSGTDIPPGSYVGTIPSGGGVVGTNVTAFTLVDDTGGSIVATGSTSGLTFSFGTGIVGKWGSLAPNDAAGIGNGTWYILTITDDDGCKTETTFTIDRDAAPSGCTDNNACNYDAAAVTDDNSCFLCSAGTGELTDPGNGFQGQLFSITACTPVETSNHTTSDGDITLIAAMQSSATFQCAFDSDETYTMTLYSCTTAGSMTGATVHTATTGIATTTYGASPNNSWGSLAHGHYAVKVQFVDAGTTHCLENCYTIFYCTVQARVCDDPTANNYVSTGVVPTPLRFIDNTLCTYTVTCCQLSSLQFSAAGTTCTPILEASIDCDPNSQSVSGYWTFNGATVVGSNFTLGAITGSGPIIYSNASIPVFTASGTYGIIITATYSNASPCTATIDGYFDFPVYGCTDGITPATNYNPSATCDDGSCVYPSYNCLAPCDCIDPGNSTGTYSTLPACQAACICTVYGCTDSCATNYDPLATDDDGSCTYKICQDPAAINFQYSCECGMQMPNATLNDPSCCVACIDPVVTNITLYSATQVTGTCEADEDGGFSFDMYSPQCGTVTYDVYNAAGVLVGGAAFLGIGPCFAATSGIPSTASEASSHTIGNYNIVVSDCCNNCEHSFWVTVPGTIDICGCTDPTADNYDPAATIDDGTCLYCGCMDPTADNYDPNAVCEDNSCSYTPEPNPCIPENFADVLRVIDLCLNEQGTDWLLKYKIGTNTDCITMNKWKLILIRYLANLYGNNDGLECLFNCADINSIDQDAVKDCNALWSVGGSTTGANDLGYAGSTVGSTGGTEITDPALFFVQANELFAGDVIKMPSGLIWRVDLPFGGCTFGCYNPETSQGATSGHWAQCVDSMRTTIPSNGSGGQIYTNLTAPYWDNFINFVNKYCANCNISLLNGGRQSKRGGNATRSY